MNYVDLGMVIVKFITKMKIITYGDPQSVNLLWTLAESLKYSDLENKYKIIFYSVNHKSDFKHEKVEVRHIDMEKKRFNNHRDFWFFKPKVLIKSIMDFDDEFFLYLDLDILVGKRFNPLNLIEEYDLKSSPFPLCVEHTLNRLGDETIQNFLKSYYSLLGGDYKWKKMIQNCFILYCENHLDFLYEWRDLCYSDWYCEKLKLNGWDVNSIGDENILSYLYMKYRFEKNIKNIYNNYSNEHWVKVIEENNRTWVSCGNVETNVDNSDTIQFYHHMKNYDENLLIIENVFKKNFLSL
jgi:hypothetical protein